MHSELLKRINPVIGLIWRGVFEAGHVEVNRRLYNHELVFFSRGRGRVIIGGKVYLCEPGSLVIIPPEAVHCTIADSSVERWCVHFDWEPGLELPDPPYEYSDADNIFSASVCNLTPEWVTYPLPWQRMVRDYESFLELIKGVFKIASGTVENEIRRKGLMLQILARCFDDSTRPDTTMSPVVLKAKEYIDQHFRECRLNVSAAARFSGVTANHLCRLFRKELNISPMDYINSLRLKNAAILLETSPLNVTQAAASSGFSDSNYFARMFRKKFRVPPSKYPSSAQSQRL